MIDEEFEEDLIIRLKKRRVNMYRQQKFDSVYELLLRYCHAKNLDVAPLVWEILDKYLKSQLK